MKKKINFEIDVDYIFENITIRSKTIYLKPISNDLEFIFHFKNVILFSYFSVLFFYFVPSF